MNSDTGENGRLDISTIQADRMGASQEQSLTLTEARDLLITKFAEAAGVDPGEIDIHEPILSYGPGSIQLISFVGELEDRLGLQLPSTLAWDYPTIEGLTEFIWAEIERGRQSGAAIQSEQ